MSSLLRQRQRQNILFLAFCCALLFFQVTAQAGSPQSGSPKPNLKKRTSAISLNAQEQQTVQKKKVLVRERSTKGKPGKIFEAVAIMEANRKIIQNIALDYASYPDFMPNVSRVDILQQEDTTALLNYTFSLPLGKIKKYRVRMKASEPDDQTSLIQWQLEKWPSLKPEETIRDTNGFWRIEELDTKRSLVLYHVYTDPGKIPFGLGWIIDLLGKDSVPEVLSKTKERAEKNKRLE
ncbi:Ribosome association toxin PasT (RatA) of the RatAB toxin-antitoxin module [Candidatus Electrothrix laxa]